MRTRTEREIERERRWQEILAAQRQSGQSVRAYCRQVGVQEPAFYWWRRKLARHSGQCNHAVQPGRGRRGGKPARPQRRKPSGVLAGVRFLPVQVATERGAEADRVIEIVLGGQRVVRILAGFDRQTLAEALAVLEARPC